MVTEAISQVKGLSLYDRFFWILGRWFVKRVRDPRIPKNLEGLEKAICELARFHDELVQVDNQIQVLISSASDETRIVESQKVLERVSKHLLSLEHQTLTICRFSALLGHPIEGADELERKYEELKAGLDEEWAYDSPAFHRIIQLAEKERQAGRVEEWP